MFARQSNFSKLTSIIVLVIVIYFFIVNIFNYFTAGSFASPLIPRSTFDEISKIYLRFAVVLLACLIVAFLFHKREKYFISIVVSLVVIVILNYFPEWFI
jgi:hypothetical protein